MRIDFTGGFRSVVRHVQAQVAPGDAPVKFADELQRGTTKGSQPTEINTQTDIKPTPPEVTDPRAQLRFDAPPQRLPELTRQVPLIEDAGSAVKNDPVSVKTPSIKAARRISDWEAKAFEERAQMVRPLVEEAGKRHGVDPALGMAVIAAESSFNPQARSSDGHDSKGLFQLLDSTGSEIMSRIGATDRAYDPFNPELNVELGVSYLRRLHDTFSAPTALALDLSTRPAANYSSLEKLAVAAFNAGEGRVASAQERAVKQGADPSDFDQVQKYLPDITQEYVARVMRYRDQFGGTNFG